MQCENARPLVPSYLDGELTEEQAGPLRAHLFDCPSCREVTKEETALKRWFGESKGESLAPPQGFAARVARRAFAGDPGVLTPAVPPAADAAVTQEETPVLPFVLKLAALAAGLLFVFSIAIQRESLPAGDALEAQDPMEWLEEPPEDPPDPERAGEETAGDE